MASARLSNGTKAAAVAAGVVMSFVAGQMTAAPAPIGQTLEIQPGQVYDLHIVGVMPSLSPSAIPSLDISPSPLAPKTPPPSASPSPVPSASTAPTPSGTPVACGASAQSLVDATPAGGTIDLGACVYAAALNVTKPITILRGTIKVGGTAIAIRANDVTLDSMSFVGGSQVVQIFGVDRTKILRNSFTMMTESSIRLQPGSDDTLVEGNTIKQTVVTAHGYSPVSANDNGAGAGAFKTLTVRGNSIDQGPNGVGWFGVEVWGVSGLIIETNQFKGVGPHISIPRSDGAIIRNNTFDLSSSFWGMELADIENAQVLNNTASATGTIDMNATWRALVQLHPGSGAVLNITISGNKLTNYPALVNAAGSGHTITNNCLINVGRLNWGSFTGANKLVSNNGPC